MMGNAPLPSTAPNPVDHPASHLFTGFAPQMDSSSSQTPQRMRSISTGHLADALSSIPPVSSRTTPESTPSAGKHPLPPLSSIMTPEMNPAEDRPTGNTASFHATSDPFLGGHLLGHFRGSGLRGSPPGLSAPDRRIPVTTAQKRGIDITSLMSPPEAQSLDSFRSGEPVGYQAHSHNHRQRDPLSPPESPYDRLGSMGPDQPANVAKDPILFPENSTSAPSSEKSPQISASVRDRMSIDRIVDDHISTLSPQMFRRVSPPTRDDYKLIAGFSLQSNMLQQYDENRSGWLKRERQQLEDDARARQAKKPKVSHLAPQRILPATHYSEKAPTARKTSSTSLRANLGTAALNRNSHRPPTSTRAAPQRASPKTERSTKRTSPRPEKRHAPVVREDKNFESLVDYSPPLSSVSIAPGSLRAEWKGNPLNIDNDKFLHLLHPEERALASGLRLDPATYLTSKRRIFISRVECYEKGKEFRKTDAQQACKIDVNKASRLHSAYDNIGWLDPKWILAHVEERQRRRELAEPNANACTQST